MDAIWAIIVILLILFVLFVILPSLLPTPNQQPAKILNAAAAQPAHPPGPSIREVQQAEASRSKAMLDMHYQAARATVPENHPRQPIGACPYTKPPSTDLPLSNVPMCVAVQPENMHLRSPPLAIST